MANFEWVILICGSSDEAMAFYQQPPNPSGLLSASLSPAVITRLPSDKLKRLVQMHVWRGQKACRKREVSSIIGTLSLSHTLARS